MKKDERQEALESIELIKELILQTKKHMGHYGGGWISIIWGIFSFVGVGGQRSFIPQGPLIGVWWTALAVVAGFATFLVSRRYLKSQPFRAEHGYLRYFFQFWLPLVLLGYTLALLIALIPSISNQYIPIVVLLVISTGYLIIGFMFFRGILYMGILGFTGTIISALFFLEYSDIVLGVLFGLGLIITGIVINKQWKSI